MRWIISNGFRITGLLTIGFIVMKLAYVIDWSWWWVLSPIWITIIAMFSFIVYKLIKGNYRKTHASKGIR